MGFNVDDKLESKVGNNILTVKAHAVVDGEKYYVCKSSIGTVNTLNTEYVDSMYAKMVDPKPGEVYRNGSTYIIVCDEGQAIRIGENEDYIAPTGYASVHKYINSLNRDEWVKVSAFLREFTINKH